MFSMQSVSRNPLIAIFQLSSAASLNLGRSQYGVLGNGSRKPENAVVETLADLLAEPRKR